MGVCALYHLKLPMNIVYSYGCVQAYDNWLAKILLIL